MHRVAAVALIELLAGGNGVFDTKCLYQHVAHQYRKCGRHREIPCPEMLPQMRQQAEDQCKTFWLIGMNLVQNEKRPMQISQDGLIAAEPVARLEDLVGTQNPNRMLMQVSQILFAPGDCFRAFRIWLGIQYFRVERMKATPVL